MLIVFLGILESLPCRKKALIPNFVIGLQPGEVSANKRNGGLTIWIAREDKTGEKK
jgi:hypothetical protein